MLGKIAKKNPEVIGERRPRGWWLKTMSGHVMLHKQKALKTIIILKKPPSPFTER
jgi:hypothetical protein